jgi:hypothetical protein
MAVNGTINTRHTTIRVAIDGDLGDTIVLAEEDEDGFRTSLLALVIQVSDATVLTIDSHIADPASTVALCGDINVDNDLNWQTPWGLCCTTEGAALRLTTTGASGTISGFAIIGKER